MGTGTLISRAMEYLIILHFYNGVHTWKAFCHSFGDIEPAVLDGKRRGGEIIRREVVKKVGGVKTTIEF